MSAERDQILVDDPVEREYESHKNIGELQDIQEDLMVDDEKQEDIHEEDLLSEGMLEDEDKVDIDQQMEEGVGDEDQMRDDAEDFDIEGEGEPEVQNENFDDQSVVITHEDAIAPDPVNDANLEANSAESPVDYVSPQKNDDVNNEVIEIVEDDTINDPDGLPKPNEEVEILDIASASASPAGEEEIGDEEDVLEQVEEKAENSDIENNNDTENAEIEEPVEEKEETAFNNALPPSEEQQVVIENAHETHETTNQEEEQEDIQGQEQTTESHEVEQDAQDVQQENEESQVVNQEENNSIPHDQDEEKQETGEDKNENQDSYVPKDAQTAIEEQTSPLQEQHEHDADEENNNANEVPEYGQDADEDNSESEVPDYGQDAEDFDNEEYDIDLTNLFQGIGESEYCPIPIILQTDVFPYLLCPISPEQHDKLPSDYQNAINLFDETAILKAPLKIAFNQIRETFNEHGNPFDEDEELILTFKDFDNTSIEESHVLSKMLFMEDIIEMYNHFVSKATDSENPDCICLLLSSRLSFKKFLRKLREDRSGQEVDEEETANNIDEEDADTKLNEEEISKLNEAMSSDEENEEQPNEGENGEGQEDEAVEPINPAKRSFDEVNVQDSTNEEEVAAKKQK